MSHNRRRSLRGRLLRVPALAALLVSCSFAAPIRRTPGVKPIIEVEPCSPAPMIGDIALAAASLSLAFFAAEQVPPLYSWVGFGGFTAASIHGVDAYVGCDAAVEGEPLADSMNPSRQEEAADEEVARRSEPRAVGSCFAVSGSGHIVTSHHVVRGAERFEVAFTDGARRAAVVVESDRKNDVAILQIESAPPHWLHVGPSAERNLGDRVFTVGYPLAKDLGVDPKFNEGAISSLSVGSQPMMMQVQIPVHPGNSGGPLVTESGSVIGVIRARPHDTKFLSRSGAIAQEISWAVRSEVVLRLLAGVQLAPRRRLDRAEAIARATRASCIVAAYEE